MIHLELFYYFISFAMGFASLIFTLVFFRKNGEVLYKYLLFFLSTLTLVVLTKTILFYIVLNTRYDLLTLYFLQFASIMGHCALIYTIPKFLHSFERFSWRGVVDGFFGSLAGLLAAGYFLFWGDAIAEIIVNLAIGLIVIIIFYSLIVVIIRWAEGKKRGRRSFQTFLLANLILAIILLPGFNLFSNFFYERFPFLEDLVLRDFYTFPAFYFLFNLLNIIFLRKELLRSPRPVSAMTIPEGFCEQYDISQRELDVMNLLLQGYRYKDIGGKLFISLATVKTHILHIYSKMDVLDKGEFLEKIRKNPIP